MVRCPRNRGNSNQHEPFESGTRVRRTETGEIGTVSEQFIDGYVSLVFDDGRPAELAASSPEEIVG